MNILAFDHGTDSGWCVLELKGNELKLIDKGIIEMTSDSNYQDFYEEFKEIFIKYEKMCPYVCLEKANIQGAKFNFDAITRLIEIRAMLKLLADERCMEVIEVNPMTLKKMVAGTAKASKAEVANSVSDTFNIEFKDIVLKAHTKKPKYEISDSIGIGYVGAIQLCVNNKIKNNKKAINTLNRPSRDLEKYNDIKVVK